MRIPSSTSRPEMFPRPPAKCELKHALAGGHLALRKAHTSTWVHHVNALRTKRNENKHHPNGTNRSLSSAMGRGHKEHTTGKAALNVQTFQYDKCFVRTRQTPIPKNGVYQRTVTTRRSPEQQASRIRQKQKQSGNTVTPGTKPKCNSQPIKPNQGAHVG